MSRRRYPQRFPCVHPGCGESAHFESATAKEAEATWRAYHSKWRCVRHTNEHETLSADNPKRMTEVTLEQYDYGKFWGRSGFVHGLGFKAFAKDFPAGTILRVTAEVIVPDTTP